ncbi:hypothetical protein CCR75_003125 [Bremia lactucae]|uniref:Uncharacterized protein n=1 Tax=Bremia lactucae TaxID=4779 RepID=A0A976ICU4_BRELC|nr:hypothetical protein CCR75_003125 [Bremia lactucae]
MLEIVSRRRSHKYARNRRVLLFLRKDATSECSVTTDPATELNSVYPGSSCPQIRWRTEKMYVRASDMQRPSALSVIASKPVLA